jgi:hypothetical protein
MSRFWAIHGLDILKGLGVMVAFVLVKYWSFDKEPRTRANGVPYKSERAEEGTENDWQSTIVDEKR